MTGRCYPIAEVTNFQCYERSVAVDRITVRLIGAASSFDSIVAQADFIPPDRIFFTVKECRAIGRFHE